MSLQTFDERSPTVVGQTFQAADGTNHKIMCTPGKTGSRVDQLIAISTSAASKNMSVDVKVGATYYTLSQVTIPASAGIGGVIAVDLLALLPTTVVGGIALPYGVTLEVAMTAALTGGDLVEVTAIGGDF
jgi:hypothetical protein